MVRRTIFIFTGDWHSAYVLLYAPKILEIEERPEEASQQKQEPMQE